jgi:hypothetical protein
MPLKHHTFVCSACKKPVSLDARLPSQVVTALLRDEFAVLGLAKAEPIPGADGLYSLHHPLVCSDACHRKANRDGLPGYDVVDGEQARFDASDTFAPSFIGGGDDDNDDERNEP